MTLVMHQLPVDFVEHLIHDKPSLILSFLNCTNKDFKSTCGYLKIGVVSKSGHGLRKYLRALLKKNFPPSIRPWCMYCRLTNKLGSGQFGMMYKGVWKSPSRGEVEVAVKILKKGSREEDRVKFLQEAAIMGQFKHPNVVALYGVVSNGEPVSYF